MKYIEQFLIILNVLAFIIILISYLYYKDYYNTILSLSNILKKIEDEDFKRKLVMSISKKINVTEKNLKEECDDFNNGDIYSKFMIFFYNSRFVFGLFCSSVYLVLLELGYIEGGEISLPVVGVFNIKNKILFLILNYSLITLMFYFLKKLICSVCKKRTQ